MFQLIQLGFSRSLGSATSNEANKSAMRRAEWTIAARRAVLRLAQIKYRYFVSERCKQNAIFSGTRHQDKAYLDNISTNLSCPLPLLKVTAAVKSAFLLGTCSHLVMSKRLRAGHILWQNTKFMLCILNEM